MNPIETVAADAIVQFIDSVVPFLPLIAVVIGGITAGIFTIVNRRGGDRSKRRPSWVELDNSNRELRDEIDEMRTSHSEFEKSVNDRFTQMELLHGSRLIAAGRIMDDVSKQAPVGFVPVLKAEDVELIPEYVPIQWRIRRLASPESV